MLELPTLSQTKVHAIIRGDHRNAFSVLGPHEVDEHIVVRVFEPLAEAVVVFGLESGTEKPLKRIDKLGFFEGEITTEDLPYELGITYDNEVTIRRRDVYAFPSTLDDMQRYLLGEGTDMRAYDKLGAHVMEVDGVQGTRFVVWAPNAQRVSVVGNFNNWDGRRSLMRFHPGAGLWEIFIPGLGEGEIYKYEVKTAFGATVKKSDPVGFYAEVRPNNASVVWDINKHEWQDDEWIAKRAERNSFSAPMSVYECHLGSWQRNAEDEWLSYSELADRLIPYLTEMGYTHLELLPVAEHPFDGSWGYQVVGYFAATSRFGTPDDFQEFVDRCHQAGIGVILDWVPAHFPKDLHAIGRFDGTALYEHADPRQGEHPDWGTYVFNFDRNEVRQFLISNALFWIEKYHIDGLRVDAVASMLYLDFSRDAGQWIPNIYGGRENIGAVHFLREFNSKLHDTYPGVVTIAEESTDWAGVTASPEDGGLGFDIKWNMGWMHDTLQYMSTDPVYRMYHHGTLTFSLLYAFSERFMLPFSHDEVVHLKKSMIDKMPGDSWQKFANLRVLYGYMFSHPGKKLMFMGAEFAQGREWTENHSLDWHLIYEGSPHLEIRNWVRDLNHFYRANPPLYENDESWDGFEWLEVHDSAHSVLAYARSSNAGELVIAICNFTPVVREGYRLGVPVAGVYQEVLNSDSPEYGGSGVSNDFRMSSEAGQWRGQPHSIQLTLPPLATIFLKVEVERE